MAGKGGHGTLNPPTDGDDVARVIPLRRRNGAGPEHTAEPKRPTSRGPLPRESAPFDPEIEPDTVLLRRRVHRRVRARLTGLRFPIPHRPASRRATLVACSLLGISAIALGAIAAASLTSHHRRIEAKQDLTSTTSATDTPRGLSALVVDTPARRRAPPHRAKHPAAHRRTHHRASKRVVRHTPPTPMTPTPTTPTSTAQRASTQTVSQPQAGAPAQSTATPRSTKPTGPASAGHASGSSSSSQALGASGVLAPGSSPDG
jgi:hypothetical protein